MIAHCGLFATERMEDLMGVHPDSMKLELDSWCD